jgi:hypothetical protein
MLVILLKVLLLVIKSLHILRVLPVFLGRSNHVFFELRRKPLNLFYICVVIQVIVVIRNMVPFVKNVMLLFLRILVIHDLLAGNLFSWEHLLIQPRKFLIIGLNHESVCRSRWLQGGTRRVQTVSTLYRSVIAVVENTHLII